MFRRSLLIACLALACLSPFGCAPPAAPPTVERGRRIDRATLEGFRRGVTTREEVLALLGEPSTTVTDPGDGSVTCSWDFVHTDAHEATAIMTTLKFGSDGRLLVRMVNQSTRKH
ncbi:MAG: hypothetical protein P4L36_02410 [Holophaga sp.]|nr:hypothetical protein [Holophaga sp.]